MASPKLLSLLTAWSLVAVASFAAMGCAAPTMDDEEALGETEDHLLSGTRYTPSQVATYLRDAGFAESAIGKMVCTAKYESSFYAKATNKNRNGSMDRGLFQINNLHLGKTKGCPSSADALFDPGTNAKCALAIFKSQGINAWYGYKKHKSECDRTRAPASAALTADATTSTLDSAPLPTDTDEPDASIDPSDGYDLGAGCWSATKQDTMAPMSCVEQKDTRIWFQCKEGKWYRGGDDITGPFGYCNGTYPLP